MRMEKSSGIAVKKESDNIVSFLKALLETFDYYFRPTLTVTTSDSSNISQRVWNNSRYASGKGGGTLMGIISLALVFRVRKHWQQWYHLFFHKSF
jgi:hypothetical protein